ncbi:MAG: heme exporter protein CcmD [Rudaea sp.]
MSEFFAMGGYAAYVWPSYAIFFIVLLLDAVAPLRQRSRVLREQRRRAQRQQARKSS